MNLLRWLLWKLGLVRIVILTDFDDEQYVRIVRRGKGVWPFLQRDGGDYIVRLGKRCKLEPDGMVTGWSWRICWKAWPPSEENTDRQMARMLGVKI